MYIVFCTGRLIESYVECVGSTTQLACTGGAAAWEAKWINSAAIPLQQYYSCIVNIGLRIALLSVSSHTEITPSSLATYLTHTLT